MICVYTQQRGAQQAVEAKCMAADKQLKSSTGAAHRHGRPRGPAPNTDDLSDKFRLRFWTFLLWSQPETPWSLPVPDTTSDYDDLLSERHHVIESMMHVLRATRPHERPCLVGCRGTDAACMFHMMLAS